MAPLFLPDNPKRIVRALAPTLLLLGASSLARAQTSAARSLPPGLVAWWPGNGTAQDASGNGHDGATTPEVRYIATDHGKAFLFNGRKGGVMIPDSPAFQLTGSLTLAARVKVDVAQDCKIVFRGDNRGGLDPWSLAIDNGENGNANVKFDVTGSPDTARGGEDPSTVVIAPVPLGKFVTVVGTLDRGSGTQRIYVDGKLIAEKQASIRALGPLERDQVPGLGIGNVQDPHTYNEPFDGIIQDVQVYRRALTPEEVVAISHVPSDTPALAKPAEPYRYWVKFPRPQHLQVVALPKSPTEAALLQTLAGLIAHVAKAAASRADQMIWIDNGSPASKEWLKRLQHQTGATIEGTGPYTTWQLVDQYAKAGIVHGYILYHYENSSDADVSLNVATSLCSSLGGIAVSDADEATATQHGLKRLLDVRKMTEQDCFERYGNAFSRRCLVLIDPKATDLRAEAVEQDALVLSRPGSLYTRALTTMEPDFLVIGHGIGAETDSALAASKQAGSPSGTDGALNVAPLSTERFGGTVSATRPPASNFWDLPWEDGVHYATFLLNGGDSLQWAMGDLFFGADKGGWNSPERGNLPIGWACRFDDLAQVCPYALQYALETATNRDDLLLYSSGDPADLFGQDRSENAADLMTRHAARIGEYARLGGCSMMLARFQTSDTQAAIDAASIYARTVPGLKGLFALNADTRMDGGGTLRWLPNGLGDEVPEIAPRFSIRSGQGDPHGIAGQLNGLPHDGSPTNADHFSAVLVDPWSWFVPPNGGGEEANEHTPNAARGLLPAKWCAAQLPSYVHVVTPTQFVQLMRLRLHPQPTLQIELARLADSWHALAAKGTPPHGLQDVRDQIHTALEALDAGDYHGAWQAGHEANAALKRLQK